MGYQNPTRVLHLLHCQIHISVQTTSIDISTKDLDENTFVRIYDIFSGGQVGSTGATSAYAYEGPTAEPIVMTMMLSNF